MDPGQRPGSEGAAPPMRRLFAMPGFAWGRFLGVSVVTMAAGFACLRFLSAPPELEAQLAARGGKRDDGFEKSELYATIMAARAEMARREAEKVRRREERAQAKQ
jgi:hypothetical protein